jgi:hypothetical protein
MRKYDMPVLLTVAIEGIYGESTPGRTWMDLDLLFDSAFPLSAKAENNFVWTKWGKAVGFFTQKRHLEPQLSFYSFMFCTFQHFVGRFYLTFHYDVAQLELVESLLCSRARASLGLSITLFVPRPPELNKPWESVPPA